MKKLRKMKNQKGFTLVEVIVVLVILAIMAAILIPSLVGYIDKARENSIVTETRSVVQATQTLVSDAYGKYKNATITVTKEDTTKPTDAPDEVTTYNISFADVSKLSEISGLTDDNFKVTIDAGKIKWLAYKSSDKWCAYPGYNVSSEEPTEPTA